MIMKIKMLKSLFQILLGSVAILSMVDSSSYGQIATNHVGSFNWRGGITNYGGGEFLYGTVTILSNGKISSSYFVPRYGDRNTFSGTVDLKTGAGIVSNTVNGAPGNRGTRISIQSWQKVGFNGTFKGTNGGGGILSGYK